MNAVELFEHLRVLDKVLWKSSVTGATVRVESQKASTLRVQVQLPFCGTWIEDGVWSVDAFLAVHRPLRR